MRIKKSGPGQYLQIVENKRVEGKTVQRVIVTPGRLDKLKESGALDSLLASGARFSESALVLTAHDRGETTSVKSWLGSFGAVSPSCGLMVGLDHSGL